MWPGMLILFPVLRTAMSISLRQLFQAGRQPKNTLGIKMIGNKKPKLDGYEREILELYEDGRLKPASGETDYQTIARTTLKKNCKINIRLPENDLIALKQRAARDGIPYQTLIGSILHKYASGFLKEAG
jgi:predicted DNA binding CopG/RHH family protein